MYNKNLANILRKNLASRHESQWPSGQSGWCPLARCYKDKIMQNINTFRYEAL